MAECHPVGFQWVMEAKERGAKVIHVDPRFSRTSAVADLHVPIRAGSDIAFLGGIVNYILENGREFREYIVRYTNAATIVGEDFRTTAIIQLLLGNIGRPGGGILALRGHASIQGSTDVPTLYNILPGYIPMRHAHAKFGLQDFIQNTGDKNGYWGHMDAYLVSMLKAWWGANATSANEYCFDYLPRLTGDHSAYVSTLGAIDGTVKGYFLIGENPAVGNANGKLHRLALAHLEWLVVRDFQEIESASFWYDSPEIETGELRTADIETEVFFLPAAAHTEKDGTFTNTQRMLQWHHKAVDPPGDARSDLWFVYQLGRRIREKLAGSLDPKDKPILEVTWDYNTQGEHEEPSADAVLKEISGWTIADGKAVSGYEELKPDGSTACGVWIYSGCYADEENLPARRKPHWEQKTWVAPEWAWTWPINRHIIYNRASADRDGKPGSERKKYGWWDGGEQEWTGFDVPDFKKTMRPDYEPSEGAKAEMALRGDEPFIMQADGKGWLYVPSGLTDGPMPTHYEPHESPFENALYKQQANPVRQVFHRKENPYNPTHGEPGADVFPYVMTSYRLTEHHTAGGMTRTLPYLSELQPEMFCEISPGLAAERGLEHGGWATIVSARTAIEARVLVTERMKPLRVAGTVVHQVGLPYHWGTHGLSSGDSANDLFPLALDPNVHIQEVKAATCDIRPGRRPRGPALLGFVDDYRRRAGVDVDRPQEEAHEGAGSS